MTKPLSLHKIYQLDYLNILLMIISLLIATISPWQLLLGAYALLGPAHYLTEISWLHDRNYFTQQKKDYIYLIILAISMVLFSQFYIPLIIITVCVVFALTLINSSRGKFSMIFLGLILAAITSKNAGYVIVLLFIPTLIHVYIFTAGFILNGAQKNHSIPGYASFFILIACGISFFLPQPFTIQPIISSYALHNFNYFHKIVTTFVQTFHLNTNSHDLLQAVRFIAFAYCYHYLNWFSKTGVIKWHEISRTRSFVIIGIYLCAISLYFYNYGLGFSVLIFLSFMHVILELPLDVLMIRNVGKALLNH